MLVIPYNSNNTDLHQSESKYIFYAVSVYSFIVKKKKKIVMFL